MKNINNYIQEKLVINKDSKIYRVKVHSKSELKILIDETIQKAKDKENIDLNFVDISELTDLTRIFKQYKFKKINIESWDVSNIKQMIQMFPSTLEQIDLSNWDVSNVETMNGMFCNCDNLKEIGDISNWDVSQVKNMANMFENCKSLKKLDLSKWNAKSLTNCYWMFANCQSLESIGKLSENSNLLYQIKREFGNGIFYNCKKLKRQ